MARKTIEKFRRDGLNSLGDHGGVKYNRKPYADTTGYTPINQVNKLVDPSRSVSMVSGIDATISLLMIFCRWQPLLVEHYDGTYRIQSYLTPQMANVKPISMKSVEQFKVPPHGRSLDGDNDYNK